tara:strand:- start:4758 stop:5342 length:585 start_codon:yes stop_codon:yes gene_type:complete
MSDVRKFICKNYDYHGETGRVWESKQTGDVTTIKCSKRGGADGCGSADYVEIFQEERKKMATGGGTKSFQERKRELFGNRNREERERQAEVSKQSTIQSGVGFVISDWTIRIAHESVANAIGSIFGLDLEMNEQVHEQLMFQAREVLKQFTFEASPSQSYFITWGVIVLPAIAKKYIGGLFGGKKEIETTEETD